MNDKGFNSIRLTNLEDSQTKLGPPGSGLLTTTDLTERSHRLTVVLGQLEMKLDDLNRLASGQVLELDRTVDSPVDVYIDDRLVARGELVAVGENYGVRIIQLAGSK